MQGERTVGYCLSLRSTPEALCIAAQACRVSLRLPWASRQRPAAEIITL